jgi:hypothetical protein
MAVDTTNDCVDGLRRVLQAERKIMNPTEMRLLILEKCGYKRKCGTWYHPEGGVCLGTDLPDYPYDLNACREFESILTEAEWGKYCTNFGAMIHSNLGLLFKGLLHATALEKCKAVCRVWFPERFK